ncbi:TetR/AcrR family transcriptional regulator [Streptomyces sodiiphilus]|uniref:TetR/AcrR family transcriptional regulator n=1 Tax=Streptomyces sodiiphilus TaxID=226217 RepID=UPI0031CF9800
MTRNEIARAAVRLFSERGVAGTSVEDIAVEAGVSLRTFWRYSSGKESCVRPLLTTGTGLMARALEDWRPGDDVSGIVDEVWHATDEAVTDLPTVLALVRLAQREPGLRAVWLQAHDDAEAAFAGALARATGRPVDDLRVGVRAAMINSALRAAVEYHARRTADSDDDAEGLADAMREALRTAVGGLA